MQYKEHIYSILIVSASDKLNVSLKELLPEANHSPVNIVKSISEAQRTVSERSYDLIIINTPLPDDFGIKFAIDVSNKKSTVVMLLVKNEIYDEINQRVMDYGIMSLRKPINSSAMLQAFDHMCSARELLRGMENKNMSLEEKMAEIRLVNRAKWLLIDNLKMTETDAHHYIEKQAMDRCVKRREIAENIIKTYQ